MIELNGKVALITGASRGIGAATAIELASHGAKIVLAARTAKDIGAIADQIRAGGGEAEATVCDISDYGNVTAAVAKCQTAFGRLDILVNNAGVIEPIARIAESDPEQWSRVADINYKGVYYGLRAAIPVMQAQGGGTIVNISSGAATGPLEGWSHYCSTKAAVLMLTQCADLEYGESGIHVVGLSPGTVATDMQVAIKESGINPVSELDPSVHIPADWPAKAIAWLCAGAASEFAGTDIALRDDAIRRRVGLID